MLYDNYQNRILEIAKKLKTVVKFLPLIIAVFSCLVVATGTLLVTKGTVGETTCKTEMVYGESPICQAKAFLGEVSFEYRASGGSTWSAEMPSLPGKYLVRGVSQGAFGKPKYGDEIPFTILPKEVDVTVVQSSIVYGDSVSASANLVHGDSLVCESFTFENMLLETTSVKADKSAITIIDREGNDVTDAYAVNTPSKSITITPRSLEVTVSDAEQEYNGMKFSYDQYEISDGQLVEGDTLIATFDQYLIDAGTVVNQPVLKVIGELGDVTHHYAITEQIGALTVNKRPLIVTTADLSVTYDGKEQSCEVFSVDESTSLVAGHSVRVESSTRVTDAGEYDNILTLKIVDGKGNDKTENYSLLVNAGKISIAKRAAAVATGSKTRPYDGNAWTCEEFTVSGLLTGHRAVTSDKVTVMEDVATRDNLLDIRILDGELDVTSNYELAYDYGTLEVTKRALSVTTVSAKWQYDGQAHEDSTFSVSAYTPLVSGHEFSVTQGTSVTDVCVAENAIRKYVILDASGIDKRNNYEITFRNGTLEITKRPITVKPMDVSKVYDGKPLEGGRIELAESSPKPLVEGHTLSAETLGSRTEVGISRATLTDIKVKSGNSDVTHNYAITAESGMIEILSKSTPPPPPPEMEEDQSGEILEGLVVAKVKAETTGRIYLRRESLGNYLGQEKWEAAPVYSSSLSGGYSYNYLPSIALENTGAVAKQLEVSETMYYMLPYYLGFDGNYTVPSSDTRYYAPLTSYSTSYYLLDQYQNDINTLKGNLGEYSANERQYAEFVRANYTAINPSTRSFMNRIITEQNFRKSDPEIIQKVAHYIQHAATYNKGYDRRLSEEQDLAVAFLSKYKEGVCRHYAAAATMMFRTLGIPARYTVGFVADAVAGQTVEVMSEQAHAWVEVYIDGVGWIMVEVTAADSSGGAFDGSGGEEAENEPVEEAYDQTSITVTPSYQYKVYDGTALAAEPLLDPDLNLSNLIAQGYTYRMSVTGSRATVGRGEIKVTGFTLLNPEGMDVTRDYKITYHTGTLEILPAGTKVISVYLYELQKYYDGTALSFADDDYEIIKAEGNARLELSLNISRVDAGGVILADINTNPTDYLSYRVYAENGADVTSEYAVIFEKYPETSKAYIPLRVDPRAIEITTESESKVYDRKPLENNSAALTQGTLASGHKLELEAFGSIIEVGHTKNQLIKCDILDKEGTSVMSNYAIKVVYGILSIIDPDD